MTPAASIAALLRADALRWHLLGVVAGLHLRDGWIAAGFVRNAVWDHLHDRAPRAPDGDVDVIYHDPDDATAERDRDLERQLAQLAPGIDWSVKNQARMHLRNGDAPYRSSVHAMVNWPETATAIAARRIDGEVCEIAAPLQVDDLLGLVLCPGPDFREDKRAIFEQRVASKRWLERWPQLVVRDA
ncbi:nucleotidyltransferase family protein [Novosphingobium olei]|uniref:Nucleotidyltransferase family protein n=1 Tax=Novosphingobium olei TaxID=2728851 RepID=A0A7Y0BLA6_9SPHN|nr:nucleotidyltransferase family protein [Novosphingobium olei]NML92479.1 nucleotidyltransferase family protein [Novosphingobium olei]